MNQRPTYVRQLAAELELLAHGSTQSWNPAGGNGVPDSRPPSGDSNPPHLQMLADWDRRGDACLEHWLGILKQHKGGSTVRHEPTSTEDDWIIDDGEGQSPDVVAQRFRCTPTRVRRLRVERGRDGETGVPLERVRERVRELRKAGKTYRAIGAELGRSKSQVERVDKKEAA